MTTSFGARWHRWEGADDEGVTARFENDGWTIEGASESLDVQYAVRCSATWQIRQLLLFRDAEEPDLWLATDGHGRWGEMNGAHRTDLDGCSDLAINGSAFSPTLPIRRLPLHIGDSAEVHTAVIDTEMLLVLPLHERYTRVADRRWRRETVTSGTAIEWEVDEFGLALDLEGEFRRAG